MTQKNVGHLTHGKDEMIEKMNVMRTKDRKTLSLATMLKIVVVAGSNEKIPDSR